MLDFKWSKQIKFILLLYDTNLKNLFTLLVVLCQLASLPNVKYIVFLCKGWMIFLKISILRKTFNNLLLSTVLFENTHLFLELKWFSYEFKISQTTTSFYFFIGNLYPSPPIITCKRVHPFPNNETPRKVLSVRGKEGGKKTNHSKWILWIIYEAIWFSDLVARSKMDFIST